MAETKRKNGPIVKGMTLTILIEDVVNDILVVVLEHGSHIYRGILLDANKRNIPPGVQTPFSSGSFPADTKVKKENSEIGDKDHDFAVSSKPIDVSASVFRHTYFFSPENSQQVKKSNFFSIRNHKPTIRLRPRQTLCSHCKSKCLDSQHGPIPISSAVASLSEKKGLLNTETANKTDNINNSTETHRSRKRPNSFEASSKNVKVTKLENGPRTLSKTSPFIKISIGETNIMNIPPRLKKSEGSDVDNHDNTTIVEPESEAVDDEVIFNFKPSLLRQQNEQLHVKTSVSKEKKVAHSQNYKMSIKSKCKFPVISSKFKPSTCSKFSKNSCVTEVKNGSKPSLVYSIKRNNIQYKGCSSSASDCEMYTTTKLCEGQNQSSDGSAMSEMSRKSRSEKKKARKLYKLRSRSQSLELKQHKETDNKPSSVSLKSEKLMTFKEGDLENLDSSSECDSSDYGDGPPGDDVSEVAKPILMKIHTDSVSKCRTDDGKEFGLEDIVWGKVKGFPWWPGRIMAINVSSKDSGVVIRQTAQVAWFGSSTMSHIECCDLYQFLEDFEAKYDRKKKSKSYQRALKQASIAAKCYQTGDLVDLNDLELDSIG